MAGNNASLEELNLFQGPEHRPFFLEGGQPVAVVVHGFLGSPAELRPLAAELNKAGWSVEGLLLPGYGAEIHTLFEKQWTDWTGAVRTAVERYRGAGRPVMLVGYSLGAAVCLNVAEETAVDGLVLIAPFWRIGTPTQQLILAVVKRIFPRFQPFRRVNLNDERMNGFFEKAMPEVNLTDPQVRQTIRQLEVPSRFVDEVMTLAKGAKAAADRIEMAVAVVQGTEDEAVKSESTRKLVASFGGPVSYQELVADHELVTADNEGFEEMARFVVAYAAGLLSDG